MLGKYSGKVPALAELQTEEELMSGQIGGRWGCNQRRMDAREGRRDLTYMNAALKPPAKSKGTLDFCYGWVGRYLSLATRMQICPPKVVGNDRVEFAGEIPATVRGTSS